MNQILKMILVLYTSLLIKKPRKLTSAASNTGITRKEKDSKNLIGRSTWDLLFTS